MQEQTSSGVVAKLEATILGMQQRISVLETTTARAESEAEHAANRLVMLYGMLYQGSAVEAQLLSFVCT